MSAKLLLHQQVSNPVDQIPKYAPMLGLNVSVPLLRSYRLFVRSRTVRIVGRQQVMLKRHVHPEQLFVICMLLVDQDYVEQCIIFGVKLRESSRRND